MYPDTKKKKQVNEAMSEVEQQCGRIPRLWNACTWTDPRERFGEKNRRERNAEGHNQDGVVRKGGRGKEF